MPRRGGAIVYVILALPVMIGFASLAVDLGRAQTATTQLQAAADAAARAAAQDLVNAQDTGTASADAITIAAANTVDGQPVALTSDDVAFGTWDPVAKTFTAGTPSTNAVQVTAVRYASRNTAIPLILAAVLGKSSVDTHAVAVAYVTRAVADFNAQGNVAFNQTGLANGGTWQTDSYISNNGAYASATARANGDLLTDGSVTYNLTTPSNGGAGAANEIHNLITGQIYTANGNNVALNWTENNHAPGTYWVNYGATADAGATTTALSAPATFPTPVMPTNNTNPAIPGAYLSGSHDNNLLDLTIADGSNVTLPGGTYTLNSLSISNGSTVQFSGPATLNIATDVTIDAAAIQGVQDAAQYLKINVCNTGAAGANSVSITNPTHAVYADLNAPLANVTYTVGNNGNDFYGRIYSNNLSVNAIGNGGFHADESLSTQFHLIK